MTTHFTLEIKLGGAAMRDGDDILRALRDVAYDYRLEGLEILDEDNEVVTTPKGIVIDLNGNQVGGWRVAEVRTDGTLSEQVYDALMAHGRRGLADAYSDRPSAESIADAVLDSHVMQPHWVRNRGQVRDLITEAIQRDRGEI